MKKLLKLSLILITACSLHTGNRITVKDFESASPQILPPGSFTSEEVAGVVKGRAGRIAKCYDRAIAGDRTLKGRLLLQWNILPEGDVADLFIKNSEIESEGLRGREGQEYLKSCVLSEIAKLRFPKKTRDFAATVIFPIAFSSDM